LQGNSYLPVSSKGLGSGQHTPHYREVILYILKDNLVMDKNRMKQKVEQHHSKNYFTTGDQVFLFLQPYKQTSLKYKTHNKLVPKFYGHYEIIQNIGQAAYKLALLSHSKIHLVFHMYFLKKVMGSKC